MNALRAFLVMLLVAALPLRASASVTAALCADAGADSSAQVHTAGPGAAEAAGVGHTVEPRTAGAGPVFTHAPAADQGGAAHPHPQEDSSGKIGHECGYCAKHCSSASFALSASAPRLAAAPGCEPIAFGVRPTLGFFPEHPERPPLAL
jgi:hypothetical protein